MKYIDKLIELSCFTRRDVVALVGNEHAAHSLIYEYINKGYIQRIRHNLYTTISLETKQPIANRFMIASNIAEDSYVSHHSAFEYYGFANQVFYEVYVSTKSRFKDFTFDDITYTRVNPKINSGIEFTNTGVRVTDLERTVIDSIYSFENIGGLEELLRCLALVPSLQAEKLINYLDDYNLGNLFQKSGFILQGFADQLGLGQDFFDYCLRRVPNIKKYLYSTKDPLSKEFILYEDWMLFAPANMRSITSKGVELNE